MSETLFWWAPIVSGFEKDACRQQKKLVTLTPKQATWLRGPCPLVHGNLGVSVKVGSPFRWKRRWSLACLFGLWNSHTPPTACSVHQFLTLLVFSTMSVDGSSVEYLQHHPLVPPRRSPQFPNLFAFILLCPSSLTSLRLPPPSIPSTASSPLATLLSP